MFDSVQPSRDASGCWVPALAFVLAVLCLPSWSRSGQAQSLAPRDSGGYTISVNVGLVVLPVSVTDRKGHVVANLNDGDFRVLDNNQPQKLAFFEPEDVPVAVGLVVDDSGSMARKHAEVAASALAFARSANPQDQMFVVYFNDAVFLGLPGGSPFTSNVDQLVGTFSSISARGKTALYDGIAAALEHLKQSPLGRKVLIVASDGGDNASRHNFRQVLEMAERSNATIYSIGLFDPSETDQNPGVLKRLAKVTGGRAYLAQSPSDAVDISRQIGADIRHQYTLGYVPSNAPEDRAYHRIRVMAQVPNHESLHVRTRAGYLAGPEPQQVLSSESPSSSRERGAR